MFELYPVTFAKLLGNYLEFPSEAARLYILQEIFQHNSQKIR